nr:hypothetical protein [Tanacetum cinerariifolium]
MLCQHGDWFLFAKRHAPSPFCIDDNRSCIKHWKSGFFLIGWRAVLDSMVWIHLNAAIDDLRPTAGSFSMDDERQLSTHVIKLRDKPEGVLVLSWLIMGIHDFLCLPEWTDDEVQEEPHLDVRSTLQRLPFYCTPPSAADAVIPDPTLEDLSMGTLITLIRSAAVIPSFGNHGGSFAAPAAEGLGTRDFKGKGIMSDDVAAPFIGVRRARPSFKPAPSFRDVFGYAIRTDFFPFLSVLIMPFIVKSKAKGKEIKKKIKSLTKSLDNLHAEHAAKPLSIILQHEPEKLARPANVASRDACVYPPTAKESTNFVSTPSVVASEQNKEWVNATVNGPNDEMTDGAAYSKSGGVFMQGTSHVLDDLTEVTVVGSKRVSSSLTDSCLLGRRESLCLLLWHHAKAFGFNLAFLYVFRIYRRMAYECIVSSGLTRIIPTPDPSLIVSLPRHSISSSPSFSIVNVCNLFNFFFILKRASSASFVQSDPVAASILMQILLMRYLSSASFRINLPMVVKCRNKLRIWFGLLGKGFG